MRQPCAIGVTASVVLMTWIVMPMLSWLFRFWLYATPQAEAVFRTKGEPIERDRNSAGYSTSPDDSERDQLDRQFDNVRDSGLFHGLSDEVRLHYATLRKKVLVPEVTLERFSRTTDA